MQETKIERMLMRDFNTAVKKMEKSESAAEALKGALKVFDLTKLIRDFVPETDPKTWLLVLEYQQAVGRMILKLGRNVAM